MFQNSGELYEAPPLPLSILETIRKKGEKRTKQGPGGGQGGAAGTPQVPWAGPVMDGRILVRGVFCWSLHFE